MLDSAATYSNLKVEPIYPVEGGMSELNFAPLQTIAAGTVLGQITTADANEVQTINYTGTVSGGTFIINIAGVDGGIYSTAALAWNISTANAVIAVNALLADAGYAGVTVTGTGGPGDTDIVLTFGGAGVAMNVPLMTITDSVTGSGSCVMAATTAGATAGVWIAYDDDGTDDGRRIARAIAVYSFRTDAMGRVIFGDANAVVENGILSATAPAWFKGRFNCADLTGLDANGAADLGRIESGTYAAGIIAIG